MWEQAEESLQLPVHGDKADECGFTLGTGQSQPELPVPFVLVLRVEEGGVQVMPRQVQAQNEAEAQPQVSSVVPGTRLPARGGHRAASFQENNGIPPKRGESRTFEGGGA